MSTSGPSRVPVVATAILLVAGSLVAIHFFSGASPPSVAGGKVRVVAAENFWGSLVSQLGGTRVSVVTVVSDPNADPHEYETTTSTAVAVAQAQLVIETGVGYDSWCAQLLAASEAADQRVLDVGALLGKVAGDNPHFWYSSEYVNETVAAIYADLAAIDPAGTTYYQHQYAALNSSLSPVIAEEGRIRALFGGTPVASTESVFEYLAGSTGLDLVSPMAFMDAVSEGSDPPAASVVEFENQLESGSVRLLVYNSQTVTPLTDQMRTVATGHGIPTAGVTETIQPADASFEEWMESELLGLENALAEGASGP